MAKNNDLLLYGLLGLGAYFLFKKPYTPTSGTNMALLPNQVIKPTPTVVPAGLATTNTNSLFTSGASSLQMLLNKLTGHGPNPANDISTETNTTTQDSIQSIGPGFSTPIDNTIPVSTNLMPANLMYADNSSGMDNSDLGTLIASGAIES